MGGFDDHVAIVGDWMPPSPSPRSFFLSMINDDTAVRSVAGAGIESENGPNFPRPEEQDASARVDQNDPTQASMGDYSAANSNAVTELKTGTRGGLVDRIAARAGFNAPRLNTESIKTADLSKNSEVQSSYLTIPPGLSPTTFLDSPVFLANSMVLPSPTTGQFPFVPGGISQNSALMTEDSSSNKGKENTFNKAAMPSFAFKSDPSSFAFKPDFESKPIPRFSGANDACGFAPQSFPGMASGISDTKLLADDRGCNVSSEWTNPMGIVENDQCEDDGSQRSGGDPNVGGSQGEDWYNWRKYGQKQVKGSEYPRSYYKCTHQNCVVKKKVERNHEGHITEIIYKGVHNHPKPPPHRRSTLGSGNGSPDSETGATANGDLTWLDMQKGNVSEALEWSREAATTSAPIVVQDYGYGNAPQHGPGDGVDGSSTFSNDDEDDDHVTHGSVEGEEPESKKRRTEPYCLEMTGTARSIREPRVVVQTTSEIDILDDGYRWRKYGQKVVKGNPNPRSYYKCTSPGCNVRKHVERASHDLKSVITTYEGKHNHDVPAARNSSHVNSGNATNHLHRSEPSQLHRGIPQYGRSPFGFAGRPSMQPGPAPGFTFGINQHSITAAAMELAGLGHSQGELPAMHPYFRRQAQPASNGMSCFVTPKVEPAGDGGVNSSDGSSSVYQELMSRMPLGPHM